VTEQILRLQQPASTHEALVDEFALTLLLHIARSAVAAATSDQHMRGLLDPFADPLCRFLTACNTACVALSLKILAALSQAQLPGTAAVAPTAGEHALEMLRKLPDVSTGAAQVPPCAPG
jgi:hypothetical protein